jgi:hypothetical protein
MSYIQIPTWENNQWTTTSFETRDDFKVFVLSLFKEPGKYEFDETSHQFNNEARRFRANGYYCKSPIRSKDYINYWDAEKNKCRVGAIYKNGNKTWYLTRDYYMWVNFLPINDKEQKKFDFPKVRDAQYHMALYELLAELHYLHAAILKKRQIASSYFHCGKLINQIWFEETPILKMGAALKDQINEKGSWKFLNEYKSFLDQHTAWYRPMNPGKVLIWQQQIEETMNGRKYMNGLKGVLQGVTFEKDPTNGVGGPCTIFFHEEAGIAPDMDETVEYLLPAMSSGHITTGLFIAAGSVGDLSQCEPLKGMILKPTSNSIYAVETDLLDDKGTKAMTGLFIPEQWSMPPYIDEYGNSLVQESLDAIYKLREQWKKDLSAEKYQLRISQHPINIEEAFAYRELSKFPIALLNKQMNRIEDKEYSYQLFDLGRDPEGKVLPRETTKLPISEFPVSRDLENKEGSIVVWEKPVENPTFGMYSASIDPVSEGKTTTSESLCSIYILKNAVEVTRETPEGKNEVFIERDRIVACWCGRFDDINKTHERLELMLEWYNAWAVVENNISLFIQYMISRKKQRHLVPKDQIMFLKDLGSNNNVYQEYGWKNTGTIFRNHLLSYAIEYLKEEIDVETKPGGEIVKIKYGIERIPDPMLIKEMKAYNDDLNVDRLVAFSALVAFSRIQQSNRGYTKRYEKLDNKHLQKSEKMTKFNSPFRHMGGQNYGSGSTAPLGKKPRSPFKNLK